MRSTGKTIHLVDGFKEHMYSRCLGENIQQMNAYKAGSTKSAIHLSTVINNHRLCNAFEMTIKSVAILRRVDTL